MFTGEAQAGPSGKKYEWGGEQRKQSIIEATYV